LTLPVVAPAALRGQILDRRGDEAQLLEPVGSPGRQDEHGFQAQARRPVHEVLDHLPPDSHAGVSVIHHDGADFPLAVREDLERRAAVQGAVDLVHAVGVDFLLKVGRGPRDQDGVLDGGLHEAEHGRDIGPRHAPDVFVLVGVDHRPEPAVGEDLLEDHPVGGPVDDVDPVDAVAAGAEGQIHQRQEKILLFAGIEIDEGPGHIHRHLGDGAVFRHRHLVGNGVGFRGESAAVGKEEELGRLEQDADGGGQFIGGEVVGCSPGAPPDVGEDRYHPLIEDLHQDVGLEFVDDSGALVIDPVPDSDAARPHPVADHGVGAEFRQHGHDPVGYVEGRHLDEGDRFGRGYAYPAEAAARHPVGGQHLVDPAPRPGNEDDPDPHAVKEHQVLQEHRDEGTGDEFAGDPDDKGLALEPFDVAESLPDDRDLFFQVVLIHGSSRSMIWGRVSEKDYILKKGDVPHVSCFSPPAGWPQ
jgi:hypothetical protein